MVGKEIIMKVYVESATNKVYFSVTFKLKRFYVYTGLQTTEKFSGMVFPKSDKSAKAKTAMLAKLYTKAEDYILMHSDESVSEMKEHLKELIVGAKRKKGKPFVEFMKEFAETRNRENTKRGYLRTMKCVEAYDGGCTFDTMDKGWFDGYISHEESRGRKVNGVYADITCIKAVFKKALEDGVTKNYPFHAIKLKKEETKKRCLSLEQMRAFRDINAYRNNGEMYRDCFMLGFYLIGINVSDLVTLKKEDLRNGRISYYRNKTGRLYDIKVEPEAMAIINKYKSRKKDRLLSFLDSVKGDNIDLFTLHMNLALRRLGERDKNDLRKSCKTPIEPKVSSYYNRHTWATFASEIGIPLETIGRALGHSIWNTSVTATYVKYDTKAIDEANRKVIDYLNSDLG